MNRILAILILVALIPVGAAAKSSKLVVHFFGSRTCGECLEIKQRLLKPLAEEYPEKLQIEIHDIEDEEAFALMVEMEEQFDVPRSSPQELFLPDTFLLGAESILESGEALIEHYLAHREKWRDDSVAVDSSKYTGTLRKRFQGFTFLGILAAGLVDGVNPCAIATMIFLISFLATQKRRRSEVLMIGLAFTGAVFMTYLLMGVGAFQVLTALEAYYWVSAAIKWTAVAVAAIFGLISFWDALVYRKTGKAGDIKLQLPKPIKMRIHRVISANLSGGQLVVGAVATGFLVTLLEAVCTGQVYLPTIVLMTRESGLKLTGWLYLIFYNFLFVLPLLLIMVMAYLGLTWNRLSKATQKHMVALKVLLGVVLVSLAGFLAVAG